MALCDNIRNSRKNKNMTQKELAEQLGVSHNTISDWESGNHKPDADSIMLLCKVLGVDANYMLDWEEKKATKNIKSKLKDALKENNLFDGEDLSEENFNTPFYHFLPLIVINIARNVRFLARKVKKHKKKTPRARTRSVEMKNHKSYHT